MKSRGIAAGLCICMTIGLIGCGKKGPDVSEYAASRTQEEAREEVRRHIEQEQDEREREEERSRRRTEEQEVEAERKRAGEQEETERKRAEEQTEEQERKRTEEQERKRSGEQAEKKSETARAAAEEELRRRNSEAGELENDDFARGQENGDSASGRRGEDGTFQVDCLSFELPEGWEKDEYMSDDYETVFAPGGDMESAMDCLIVSRVSEAFGMVDMFLENMDEVVSILEEEMAKEDVEYRVTIDDIGMTFLGHTLKMKAFVRDEESAGIVVLYFAEDDINMYSVYAYTLLDEENDIDHDAGLSIRMEEALRMFFETGQVENRKL